MALFESAAKYVANEASKKTLHPVEDLNSAERFKPLCIVERKKSFWFWKKPSMIPTQVTLNDMLTKDITVVATQEPFILLKGLQEHPTLDVSGEISAKIAKEFNFEFQAADKMNLTLKLGDIEKSEAPWENLFEALQSNPINLMHPIYQHAIKSSKNSLCVVMESLATVGDASLEKSTKVSLATDDEVNLKKLSIITTDIHAKGSVDITSSHSFKIPPNTVLAYSCVEFSVDPSTGIITLHGDFDTFDDDDGPLVLRSVQGNPTDTIKEEFNPLLQSPIFKDLQSEFKTLLGNGSDNDFLVMHILLYRASLYMVNKSNDNHISISTLKHLLGDSIKLRWKGVMKTIGFTIPKDGSDPNGAVVFPNEDDSGILKACLGLVDSIIDIGVNSRKILSGMPSSYIRIIMDIVEMQSRNQDSSLQDANIKSMIQNDPSALNFLTDSGFLRKSGDQNILTYTGNDSSHLLDIFAVLYMMSM